MIGTPAIPPILVLASNGKMYTFPFRQAMGVGPPFACRACWDVSQTLSLNPKLGSVLSRLRRLLDTVSFALFFICMWRGIKWDRFNFSGIRIIYSDSILVRSIGDGRDM